ncbi:MAG: IclR family transcriptional regulator [Halothiobacillus sp. 13-55-253]|nr:MAG: IclR family transcriptional regulator [Halothiobacillus sp. 13-55-253]
MSAKPSLIDEVRACRICQDNLPFPPRPILQFSPSARLLIAGQAPGKKAHQSGVPFDDASGDRLRGWLGLSRAQFYDERTVAILPMGFCFPGTGTSGDLPPRPECAPAWRSALLDALTHLEFTIVIGRYAQAYHFGTRRQSLTEQVQAWREHWPEKILLPHPSPRNQLWLKRNPWFKRDLVPALQARVADVIGS